jgi:hypothetical protein
MKKLGTLRKELKTECEKLAQMASDFTEGSDTRFQQQVCTVQLIKTEIVRRENKKGNRS